MHFDHALRANSQLGQQRWHILREAYWGTPQVQAVYTWTDRLCCAVIQRCWTCKHITLLFLCISVHPASVLFSMHHMHILTSAPERNCPARLNILKAISLACCASCMLDRCTSPEVQSVSRSPSAKSITMYSSLATGWLPCLVRLITLSMCACTDWSE